MKRRLFSAVLVLAMLLSLALPASAANTLIVSRFDEEGFDARDIPIFDQTTGTTYRLGDTSADVTVLVAGRCRCGLTAGTVRLAQKLFLELNISNGQIFLLDMDGTADEVARTTAFYKENAGEYPDIHIAWDAEGTYEYFFWAFCYAADPGFSDNSLTLPTVCVLNGDLEPVSYLAKSNSDIDEEDLTAVLSPFAGEEPLQLPPGAVAASPSSAMVVINDMAWLFEAYNIGGANYFKLRDLAFALSGTEKQFEVGWDGTARVISLTSGASYTPVGGELTEPGSSQQAARPTASQVLLDGSELSFTAYNINGANYFKLRDIAQAFDFGVDWNGEIQMITITTGKGYIPD